MCQKVASFLLWLTLGIAQCKIGDQDEENLRSDLLKVRLFTISLTNYELSDVPAPDGKQCCPAYKDSRQFCNEMCEAEFRLFCLEKMVGKLGVIKLSRGRFDVQMRIQVNDSECFAPENKQIRLMTIEDKQLLVFTVLNPLTNEEKPKLVSKSGFHSITYSVGKICHPYMGVSCDQLCLSYGSNSNCDFYTGKLTCRGFYKGAHCDTNIDACSNNPCLNDGVCSLDSFGAPVCTCKNNGYGQFCEHKFCKKTNCIHGDCLEDGSCKCSNGFTGDQCTEPICDKTFCPNSGACFLSKSIPLCVCSSTEAYGKKCENSCSNTCLGGSTCTEISNQPKCFCPFGKSEPKCANPIQTTDCTELKCANGGKCKKFSATEQFCECPTAYTGKLCDKPVCSLSNCIRGSCMDGGFCSCIESYIGTNCDRPTCIAGKSCLNNGICVSSISGISCDCDRSFAGPKCQFECVAKCSEHGRCEVVRGEALCICDQYYTGSSCDINIEEKACNELNCKNGGECKFIENKYQCACSNQWTGSDCSISRCKDNYCKRGVCLDGIGCACTTTFLGENCSIASCTGDYCNNQGICSIFGNTQTCQCLRSFYGNRCQYACNPRCVHGQCYNDKGESKCRCDSKFYGVACENEDITEFVNTILLAIAIIIASIACLAFLTALLSNLVFKRQKREELFVKGTIQEGFNLTLKENKNLDWGALK